MTYERTLKLRRLRKASLESDYGAAVVVCRGSPRRITEFIANRAAKRGMRLLQRAAQGAMAPSLLEDWLRLYPSGPSAHPRVMWRPTGADAVDSRGEPLGGEWYAAGNDVVAVLREMLACEGEWEIGYEQGRPWADARGPATTSDIVVIASSASADYWRGLLRCAGEIPA